MKTKKKTLSPILLLVFLSFNTATHAAIPKAMLQNSAHYAIDNTVHVFRVPTSDSLGKIRYYDAKINLVINNDGSISPNARVTSALSPTPLNINVQPGTYQETGGIDRCTVTNINLTNGRVQSFFRCTNGTNVLNTFEFSVATGPVSAGHPFLAQLLTRKVNVRTDVGTQSWGITTNNGFSIGSCFFSAIGTAIGVKTNGSLLVINVITNDNLGVNTYCAPTITKLP